jgi:hypothetical protein
VAAIASGRGWAGQGGAVIAFGPHVWKERLEAAVAAGADAAASRGEVLEGLAGLLDRTCPRRRAEECRPRAKTAGQVRIAHAIAAS